MEMLNGQIAFSLEQDLAFVQQETIDDELIKETYRHRGLILLTAETKEGRFRRTIDEFLLTDEVFSALQGRSEVSFNELRRLHDEAVAEHKVELHESGGMEVESDQTNNGIAIPAGPPITPYDLPNDPIPIPAFILYWPTVTPVLSQERIKPGESWQGSILVQIGAGEFPLSYSVNLVEYVEDDPLLRITLYEVERVAMVGMNQDIALHLNPRGIWTIRISHEDGLWIDAKGHMTFSVRARYKEDEQEIDLEVLRWENKFTVERIPVTFDDNNINPIAWKAKPSMPEAEKPPLPPR
jgi:hypothetical protein